MSTSPHTYKAEETSTSSKFHFVKTGTAERGCILATSAGEIVIGIAEDDETSGEGVSVVDDDGDTSFLYLADSVDEGAELKTDADGHGIPVATNATPENQWIGATALEAGSSGDCIMVRKCGYWKYA